MAKMGHFRLKRRIGAVPVSDRCRAIIEATFAPFRVTRPAPYRAGPTDRSLPHTWSSAPDVLMLRGDRRYSTTGGSCASAASPPEQPRRGYFFLTALWADVVGVAWVA